MHRRASLPAVFPHNNVVVKRRRQSIFDMLTAPASPPPVGRSGSSFHDNYTSLKTSEERIEKALQKFRRDVLEPFVEDVEAESIVDKVKDFVDSQILKGLSYDEAENLKYDIMNAMAVDIKEVDHFKVMKTFGKALLSYFDIITDVLVLLDLIAKGNTRMALIQGISLGVSFLIQSILSLAMGQPLWVVLSGLVGMKPAIESWRDATRAKPFPKQRGNNEFMLMLSRMVEVSFESIPQSLVQTLALIVYKDQRTSLQFISLVASFVTTGFVVASADRAFDKSKDRRKKEPLLFGYVSHTKSKYRKQLYASISFFTHYKMAKIFSLAILIASSSFRYAIILLILEWLGILALRKSYENWRWYLHGLDGVGFSLFAHFGWYICILSAPFPIVRIPNIMTPRIYAGSLIYMLTINFGMVFLSYRSFDGTEFPTENQAILGLTSLTIICVISGRIAYHYVPESHKGTFYKALTFKDHMLNYMWNDCVYNTDHHQRITIDQEYIRAYIPCWCSQHYVPKDKVLAFYKEHWNDWCEDPPDWFDDTFKAMIPDYVMDAVKGDN